MRSIRATIVVELGLILAALFGASQLVPNWRIGQKTPQVPVAELRAKQAELERLKAESAAREAALAAASAKALADQRALVQAGQQLNEGTRTALARVPSAHVTKEVALARNLSGRVSLRLAAAIGALPADQRDEIVAIVDQALSDSAAELAEARRKLEEKDAEAAALATEKTRLEAKIIPELQQAAAHTREQLAATEAARDALTTRVSTAATELLAERRRTGTLSATVQDLGHQLIVGAAVLLGGWAFFALVLPGLVKHLPAGGTKTALRHLAGVATSPLLYLDANRKLSAKNAAKPPTT